MMFVPRMERVMDWRELRSITLGHPLVDAYLEFVGARGAVNTWLATAYDLKVFFEVVGKEPAQVGPTDVFAFVAEQCMPRRENIVRIEDGEAGLSARTIARRLSSIAGLFEYLLVRGDAGVDRNPVRRGLAGTARGSARQGRGAAGPAPADVAQGALPGHDRPVSLRPQRAQEPVDLERPAEVASEACFVVLKGPRRGMPLTAAGLDEVIDGARERAGVPRLT
jgi:hypothetical protein